MKKSHFLSLRVFFMLLSVIAALTLAMPSSTTHAEESTEGITEESTEEVTKESTEQGSDGASDEPATLSLEDATSEPAAQSLEDLTSEPAALSLEDTTSEPAVQSLEDATSEPTALSLEDATSEPAALSLEGATNEPAVLSLEGATNEPASQSLEDATSEPAAQSLEETTGESTGEGLEETTEETSNPPGTYVGYLSYYGVYTSSGHSAPDIFITPKDNYDRVKNGDSMDSSQVEVAYCINMSRNNPHGYEYQGWYWFPLDDSYYNYTLDGYNLYNKSANATGAELSEALDDPREGIDETELRNRVISVLLNGYPLNYSGLNTDKNGDPILTDGAFRVLTQWALWYYTDNFDIEDYSILSEEEQSVYQALIDTLLPDSVTHHSVSAVDLYLWDGNPAFSTEAKIYNTPDLTSQYLTTRTGISDPFFEEGYQNLLAARTSGLKAFSFSKEDADGNALIGATIELQDENGEVMNTWVSDGTVHTFNVFTGTYNILVETDAPDGYQVADPIAITINSDGSVYKDGELVDSSGPIVMVDELLHDFQFSKQDTDGEELAGATIELRSTNGKVVETWISDGSVHTFSAIAGTYTLVETQAPRGYKIADPISVTVNDDGSIQTGEEIIDPSQAIVMVDEILPHFPFSKQDAHGKELAGATIELRDADGKVVETWTSDGSVHTYYVAAGTYTLVETQAPEGYKIADPISITVNEDKSVESNGSVVDDTAPIVMVDEEEDIPQTLSSTDEDKPTVPTTDSNTVDEPTTVSTTSPDTGDHRNPLLLAGLLFADILGIGFICRKRRFSLKK